MVWVQSKWAAGEKTKYKIAALVTPDQLTATISRQKFCCVAVI